MYHRLHAELWAARLRDEPRFEAAVAELWPYALGMLEPGQRDELARRVGREPAGNGLSEEHERGMHTEQFEPLWLEMTEVRRSAPGAEW